MNARILPFVIILATSLACALMVFCGSKLVSVSKQAKAAAHFNYIVVPGFRVHYGRWPEGLEEIEAWLEKAGDFYPPECHELLNSSCASLDNVEIVDDRFYGVLRFKSQGSVQRVVEWSYSEISAGFKDEIRALEQRRKLVNGPDSR